MNYGDVVRRVQRGGEVDPSFAARVMARGGVPAMVEEQEAALRARKITLSRMRLAPPEFPEGEEWMSVPEHTTLRLDVCVWKHRSGAEFLERVHHPWGKFPWVAYGVSSPFFHRQAPAGCRYVYSYYPDSWYEYSFAEDAFEAACAFCLKTYADMASRKMGDRTPRQDNPREEWDVYDYETRSFD